MVVLRYYMVYIDVQAKFQSWGVNTKGCIMDNKKEAKTERLRSRKEQMAEVAINGASIAFCSFCAALGALLATAMFESVKNRNKAE